MSARFKEFAKTPRGKLTIALSCLGLSWIFLLWQFSGNLMGFIPSSTRLAGVEREVKELRTQNAQLRSRQRDADNLKKRYRDQQSHYWSEKRDGVIDTELRNLIQQAAREAELKLNTLGSVRTTRINTELYYAEIDLSTTGSVEAVTRFLAAIKGISPQLSWRRLDLRPEMRWGGANASSTTTSAPLVFNGAIRIIGYDGTNATATVTATATGEKK